MIDIKEYKIIKELFNSTNNAIYKAIKIDDKTKVIIKFLKKPHPSALEISKFKNEYEILKKLNIDGVVKVYSLNKYKDSYYLVLEDFNASSILELIKENSLNLQDKVYIAQEITKILSQIHSQNIIHKDINPSNILYDPKSQIVKIIDFELASNLSTEKAELKNLNILEGTLTYISPEQSGRMNREIDYRSDIYSCGVTLYHLFSGEVPFNSNDPLELIHLHLAKKPTMINEINKIVPEVISNIIYKMMEKNADDRYQSAIGASEDFANCLNQLIMESSIKNFEIAKEDYSEKFKIPQKLYGRSKEIKILKNTFDRACNENSHIILVAGYSGIGKSVLVKELQRNVLKKRGFFIEGKFEQFQKNIPYSAITKAFENFVSIILSEQKSKFEKWKKYILDIVGELGKVLTDIIPSLELIIGKQPPIPKLPSLEAQNRFNYLFEKFLNIITKEQPIVLFIDDLQWIDLASLKLIQILITNIEHRGLLIVGAYRDNEVNTHHPLMLTINEIEKDKSKIETLTLKNLRKEDIKEILIDTLKSSDDKVLELSKLLYEKTKGNPFFTKRLLHSLNDDKKIIFNLNTKEWEWDIEAIKELEISDNVVELLLNKIKKLNKKTQEVLKISACIGNIFELSTLAMVSNKKEDELIEILKNAINEEFIYQKGDSFYFVHDRIQQATYLLIPENERKEFHFKIGKLLLKNIPHNEYKEYLFDILYQLNQAKEFIKTKNEKLKIIKMNLLAGKKAKASTAYHSALEYLNEGRELLIDKLFENEYKLKFELFKELAECEYLNGNFNRAEELFTKLSNIAKTKLDSVEIYNLRLILYMNRGNLKDAIDIGNEGLKLFKEEFPNSPEELISLKKSELKRVDENLKKFKNISDIARLPEMTNGSMKAVMDILMNLGIPAFITKKELFPIVALRMVNLSLENGNSNVSAYGYAFYGMIKGAILGDFKGGYEFGELSLKIHHHFNNKLLTCKLYRLYGAYIDSWTNPFEKGIEYLREAFNAGVETGDMVYAGYCLNHIFYRQLLISDNLEEVKKETEKGVEFFFKTKEKIAFMMQKLFVNIIKNLQGETLSKFNFSTKEFNENEAVDYYKETKFYTSLAYYYIHKSQFHSLYGDYENALINAKEAEKFLDNIAGNILLVEWAFYYTLSILESNKLSEYQDILNTLISKIQIYFNQSEVNFGHKYYLLKAKLSNFDNLIETINYYDKAINLAQENGFTLDEAFFNELTGKFLISQNRDKFAKGYLEEAFYIYKRIGAYSKVKDLEEEYPFLHNEVTIKSLDSKLTMLESKNLDFESVLKASQTLSSEIVLDKLLKSMMKIVIENAGANRGVLIIKKDDKFIIEALIETPNATEILKQEIDEDEFLSKTIFNYVINSKNYILIDNAIKDTKLRDDIYINQKKPKSILAIPLLKSSELVGILYLENFLTTSAFTYSSVETLKILSSQIAISIENANLYYNLEQRVNEEVAKRTEQEQVLIQQSKLASMGEMIGNIAHQWRQPLNSLGVIIQDMEFAYEDGELDDEYVEKIINNSSNLLEKMSKTIDDFRNFFKPDKKKDKFKVSNAIKDALSIIDASLKSAFIKVELNIINEIEIDGYHNEYSQVVLNILNNAKDALKSSNSREKIIHIDIDVATNGKSKVSISDNGGGVKDEIINKIFEPYFTTKFKSEGTGIGLYMSKMIIERSMEGVIRVENIDGGAKFTIEV